MKINQRIRSHIEASGLKFSHVAKKSGVGIKTFSQMMNAKRKITAEEYEKICIDGLSVECGYFFDDKFLESKKKTSA